MSILLQGKDKTTGEILEEIETKFTKSSKEEIFGDMQKLYLAMRESGQILLRGKHVGKFEKTRHLKLFKLECISFAKQ